MFEDEDISRITDDIHTSGVSRKKVDRSEVKKLENEIEEIDSLQLPPVHETIDTFETQPVIWPDPEVIAELNKSDDSIYGELSDDNRTESKPQTTTTIPSRYST